MSTNLWNSVFNLRVVWGHAKTCLDQFIKTIRENNSKKLIQLGFDSASGIKSIFYYLSWRLSADSMHLIFIESLTIMPVCHHVFLFTTIPSNIYVFHFVTKIMTPFNCTFYDTGRPLPEVKWLKNGRMIDTSYEFVGNNYALNELRITNLGAQHSADLYTCEASNNNESNPISHSVNMDVYRKLYSMVTICSIYLI